jgi:DNA-binding NtrC family response regulator
MKRILVIDESEVVRETLALILGREFAVVKRPLAARGGQTFADVRDDVDLLIFGVTPQLGSQVAALLHLAAQLPFAVLFLVDSKTIARSIENEAEVACIAKPFNPYELHQKVGQLLARRAGLPVSGYRDDPAAQNLSGYLDFPFLSRSAASLARRFAAARLPLLLSGEMGCGQDRVAAAICNKIPGLRLSVNAAEATEDYLAELRLRFSMQERFGSMPAALVIQSLDKCSLAAQSRMLDFLEEVAGKRDGLRCVTTANTELLEQVYRGEFLEALYYKLAILTLRLPPLRERRDEVPVLAEWLARAYARKLDLADPEFSAEAKRRLSTYLWFGNVCELETVIARSLAYHRKPRIEEGDLIFDFSRDPTPGPHADFAPAEFVQLREGDGEVTTPKFEIYGGTSAPAGHTNGHAKMADLNVVIHELAHELKNPMVTIKTFAQLLGERYQDENFRTRFQEVVGSDIERMDDLLEMMIEFADFARPRFSQVSLAEKVRGVLTKIHGECAKRQARFEWKGNGGAGEIRTDESQLEYILKNILLVTLSEARMGSSIEVDLSREGVLALSYMREEARVASISHYLDDQSHHVTESILPLRVLLAKHLLERNGGRFAVDSAEGEKETLRLEFSLAEHRNEN